jgi:hypothetical protein
LSLILAGHTKEKPPTLHFGIDKCKASNIVAYRE